MNPSDIGPHPDAPDYYIEMGKPADWNEADCGKLAVRRVAATDDILFEPAVRIVTSQLPSGDTVYPAFMSEWQPSPEERDRMFALLMAGEPVPIRMLISGNGLPPVALWLRGEDEA